MRTRVCVCVGVCMCVRVARFNPFLTRATSGEETPKVLPRQKAVPAPHCRRMRVPRDGFSGESAAISGPPESP